MLLLSLALSAQTVPNPETGEEITVIGQKLKTWRAKVDFGRNGASCKIKQSTGDAEIDRIGCTAMEQCWPEFLPGFEATRAKGVSDADRAAKTAELNKALGACVMAKREAMIGELADKRVAARRAGQ
ncbi:hypothetical protein [Sphingomonas sp. KR3-1]|uniref:hypothetical protein n=1 Tax=Sphingomonas sp. KR3-1 TaxID=3156611 RepID=UPI0032B43B14